MIVTIPYRFIEEHAWCEKEFGEYLPYAEDATYEFGVDECEFEYADLIDIVIEYFDDIVDIILSDKRLTNALVKKMRSRKIDAFMNDAKDEGGNALKNRKNEVTQK
ncbi:hypothetical protein YN1551_1500 [Sulfolobus islandicus Y.N.15.51]|uniref:Uncharacterized protein n=1 Tax=Saccharolobus islandicus (strain Y.N.15.51 / Yellowstone \|nr:hypothetical protein [Sulfolobus islandicus]ACP48589.1 hypothetical protein YN1551_1500 [Sulfolobus islandicus Y.N.15.51]